MKTNIILFDRPYPPDLIAEGQAIQWAVTSGACNECKNEYECEHNRNFKFPKRAACMQKKAELIRKMSAKENPPPDGHRKGGTEK